MIKESLLALSVLVPAVEQKPVQLAVVCFGKGEQRSGMTKICFYDCLGSAAAITISSTQICPITINR